MNDTQGHPDVPHEGAAGDDGLLGRLEVIEAQPLEQRAAQFDQLAEEMLAELQRSDREPSSREHSG